MLWPTNWQESITTWESSDIKIFICFMLENLGVGSRLAVERENS